MKTETKLAKAFQAIAEQEGKLETTASQVLGIIKEERNLTEEKFDELVSAAYEANGWNAHAGRPSSEDPPKDTVPGTVRTYVSIVRRAIRADLKVAKFDTFTSLRTALDKADEGANRPHKRNGGADIPKRMQKDFIGVEVEQPKEFNEAIFHDIPALYLHLPTDQRELFKAQLVRLLEQYKKHITGALELKKAA